MTTSLGLRSLPPSVPMAADIVVLGRGIFWKYKRRNKDPMPIVHLSIYYSFGNISQSLGRGIYCFPE